jgi:PleD family two-component response regulator
MELIRRASAALYLAKTMGRNRVVADEPEASAISGR